MIPAESPPAFLKFEHLGVRFGQNQILEDICATVPRGGSTVLTGPNGAGKTTLLLCLVGAVPYSGRICLAAGKNGAPPRIGYVPQQLRTDSGLPLLVGEFLALDCQRRPLWLGVRPEARVRSLEMLSLVQAGHLARRRIGELSGGELRRVLLAAALAGEPDLLLLDEPAGGVDMRGERLFWEVLNTARIARNFTQLMVSHNLPLAAHHATHIICLNKSVCAQGAPRATLTAATLLRLFGAPIHLYPDQCDVADPACPQCGALDGPDHPPSDRPCPRACNGCSPHAAQGDAGATQAHAAGERPYA
ncbi:metal ABC transporter ATP-binding protein [Candidatus Desulfovibrio trichonymphae]|uniref:Mn2+/Zn2+ ABC transporter ATP-binding protein n=1 Tax=Candidatus Desulfovibrio trichonymphae TaxID=1725232 RepID=A0A1J1DST0_9BACT|nr:metal ABC transporter ATP-binding protein [Candidatus Desulfovibrio trichonymphae]BAV91709.1 Mn2+/Zn2+ ABC transporter ATP-binding protein [Candidatus Desulfovibrio trichonymphae]GHU95688.1 hypothetical protein AGMMS49974_07740 [Deltaproteobacteria bacterium]